jgi:chromosome segregation ATPase
VRSVKSHHLQQQAMQEKCDQLQSRLTKEQDEKIRSDKINQSLKNELQNSKKRVEDMRLEIENLKNLLERSRGENKKLEERVLATENTAADAVFKTFEGRTDKRLD